MKVSKFLIAGATFAALAGHSWADQTVNITGSSAFRSAVVKAILMAYTGTAKVAYVGSLSGGNQQLFSGTITGLPGITYIRTCWNGSVEGVQSLANPGSFPTTYIPINATVSNANPNNNPPDGGTAYASALQTATPVMAFSDVYQVSTPVTDPSYNDDQVGVVPFKWVANEGATVSNMTTQLANALFGSGNIQLSQFTGNAADSAKKVYLTGRYNGSGTRASTLAEVGYGVFNQVHQYAVCGSFPNGTITGLQIWPTGTANFAAGFSGGGVVDSTAGNGGYNSGGNVRDVIGDTITGTSTVTFFNTSGSSIGTTSGSNVQVVSYLGLTDAASSNAAGHIDLNYNGVSYSATNVQNGFYTFWGYEHLLYDSLTSAEDTVRTAIENNMSSALSFLGNGTAGTVNSPGLGLDTMAVGRGTDGGLVGP